MSYTIVEYFGGDEGHRCGYCKNEKSNFSHGKWMTESGVLSESLTSCCMLTILLAQSPWC